MTPELQLLRQIREQDFLCDSLRARIDEHLQRADRDLARENRELRRMLCLAHAGAAAYLDDGEVQDASAHPCIDYLRDSPDVIRDKLHQRAINSPAGPTGAGAGAGACSQWSEAVCAAGLQALEARGFRTGASGLGHEDLRAMFLAMTATAAGAPAQKSTQLVALTDADKRVLSAAQMTLGANRWDRLAQALQEVLDRISLSPLVAPATGAAAPGNAVSAGVPEDVHDRLYDSAWIAGAKFGWNCGVAGTVQQLNTAIDARIRERVATKAGQVQAKLNQPVATPEPDVHAELRAALAENQEHRRFCAKVYAALRPNDPHRDTWIADIERLRHAGAQQDEGGAGSP